MELFILYQIELMRKQMIQEALKEGQLTNKKVVTLSQKLDRYIVFYQQFKNQAVKVIDLIDSQRTSLAEPKCT